jgi:protocatechuate 3,4-dioxygenase beta subunit
MTFDPAGFLSRRGFLIAGGIAFAGARSIKGDTPACTLTGEQEEGPYYVDDETLRRDITESRPGLPLVLDIRLVDSKRCTPLSNAAIDIWHCDASGVYSGFTANSPDGGPGGRGRPFGPPPPPNGFRPDGPLPTGFGPGGPGARNIDSTRFLRGVQLTDKAGLVEFSTLYPGWYSGRAIHVHLKVHIGGAGEARYAGGHIAHTGQLFFPEDITERVARMEPYAKRLKIHRTTQTEDGIFQAQHGAGVMLSMERIGKKDDDGYRATVTLAVDPDATPAPVGGRGGRGPGGPPPRRG